jgi:hypothetical protein
MRNLVDLRTSALVLGFCWLAFPAAAAEITLDAGPGIKWVTLASPNGNPQIPVKKDDVLIIRQADSGMQHGFRFTGAGAPSSIPLCDAAPAPGTIFCQVSPYNRDM